MILVYFYHRHQVLNNASYYPVDVQIQEIANSATMQTVSSTLAVALAEAEASQSRSMQLRLDNEISKLESKSSLGGDTPDDEPVQEAPPSKESLSATKRLRDAMSYKIGGHCFRADDDSSSAATPMHVDEDENAKDLSLTRLQYVVTSVFGLREAAQNKSTRFEYHSSRLLMTSTGPNIVGGKHVYYFNSYLAYDFSLDCVAGYSIYRRPQWLCQGDTRFSVLL